jgi:hypothetical protein
VRVLAIVVLAGCWHGTAPHEPLAQIDERVAPMRETRHAPITCKRAITHAIELARAELERTPGMKDRSELIRESLTESCEVMDWSLENITCFDDAAAYDDLRECQQKLTSEQSTDLFQRINDVMSHPVP